MGAVLAAVPTRASPVARWKRELDAGREALQAAYREHGEPHRLLVAQAKLTDRILRGLWSEIHPPAGSAQVAVGGYGRGELFPHSDVDVIVRLPRPLIDEASRSSRSAIERFVGLMWDTGLEVGHSVRTIDECDDDMRNDVVVRTSL